MLVCNVSLRPPRAGITADIAEVIEATDATATGNIVFATLVDDPASVGEVVDAYLGEIMLEAATATGTPDASILQTYDAAIDETVTASDTIDATAAVSSSTWNPSDKSANITLSSGNLTATLTASFNTASVRAVTGRSSGKFYWEITYVSIDQSGTSTGLAPASASLPIASNAANGSANINGLGVIKINGTDPFGGSIGTVSNGTVIGVAVDLAAQLIWFRVSGGNWNNSGSNNPATGVGGASISSMTYPACPHFTGDNVLSTQAATANFGASAFAGTVPSGFTAGWPI